MEKLLAEGKLRRKRATSSEISSLLDGVDRDLRDSEIDELSLDRRFAIAYQAAQGLASIVVRAAGYSTRGPDHHRNTFLAMLAIMGASEDGRAKYFDTCRRKRNNIDYDSAGVIGTVEAEEIVEEARVFRSDVLRWFRWNHSELINTGD